MACLLSLSASAEVFTYLDAGGNRVFTDHPTPGNAQRLPLAPGNRMSATSTAPAIVAKQTETKPLFRYQSLRVLAPEPDATVRSSAGDLIVSIASEPDLQPGHRYRLLLDDQPITEPSLSLEFPLTTIDRGTHNLSVEIVDEQGRTIERSANRPFHMQRISLAQKRKVKPCALSDYGQRPECPLADKPEEKNSFLRFF
jgi:hypothetical protein